MESIARTLPHLRVVEANPEPTALTDKQKKKREALATVMRYIRKIRGLKRTDKLNPAIADFVAQFNANALPASIVEALSVLQSKAKQGTCPNRATLYRWDDQYRQILNGDTTAGVPKHKGSERKTYGWEALALRLWQRPSKPSMASVACELREDHGFDNASDHLVRAYLKSMPANLGGNSSHRMGQRLYKNTQRGFVHRDTDCVPPGTIYQGDGHTLDVYLAHPMTGDIWRAELTAWIDVGSRYVAGWYISESESSHSTLFALSHALMEHNHVPAMLHIDNGSGYASKMMNDASTGFYSRFDIDTMFALPYNAKAKGQVERFFGTMERDFGKRFDTYCGEDMAPEVLQKIVREVKSGKRQLPTLQQYITALAEWINNYHHRPHRGLDGKTPAELWAQLERVPVEVMEDAIVRPRTERTIQRSSIRHQNRWYSAPDLVAYNGQKIIIEYCLRDDSSVRVLLPDGRWICDASLIEKAAYIPASRLHEAQQRRLDGQRKRLQRRLDEAEQRSDLNITHEDALDDITALDHATTSSVEQKKNDDEMRLDDLVIDDLDIDFLSTDY